MYKSLKVMIPDQAQPMNTGSSSEGLKARLRQTGAKKEVLGSLNVLLI